MGWGSILSKIGLGIAAPFTGGASLAAIPAIDGLSSVLGGASKSGAAQNASNDQLRLSAENSKLARDKFAAAAPATRMNTSIRAALGKNIAPSTVNWGGPGSGLKGEVPQFSGGVNGALQGVQGNQNTQDLLSQILQDELSQQKTGGATGGNQDATMSFDPKNIGKTSLLDKILGGGALGTSILGAVMKRGGGQSTPAPVTPPPSLSSGSDGWD